jgi:hypothetical protein
MNKLDNLQQQRANTGDKFFCDTVDVEQLLAVAEAARDYSEAEDSCDYVSEADKRAFMRQKLAALRAALAPLLAESHGGGRS